MKRIFTFLIVTTIAATATGADKKADELIAQARAALGGEKQVANVHALSFAGTISRAIGDRTVGGELTLELQLPDKMLRTDSISPMGDAVIVTQEQGFNGNTLLRFSKVSGAGPGMMIRTPPPPAAGSPDEAQQLRNSRADFARLAVAMLLMSPAAVPVTFSYAGEAESPDGKADVIDLKGEGSLAAKLFLDQKSHRPLMVSYRGVSPQIRVQTQTMQGPGGRGRSEDDAGRAAAAPPAPELVDINMFFEDYKPVDGVMLPHHVMRSVDGKTTEEWTFKTVKVNPAFKADTFEKK
jgi:hypothetical protein